MQGSQIVVLLNSRLESNKEEEGVEAHDLHFIRIQARSLDSRFV